MLKGLWCEERFDFDGQYFRLEDAVCQPTPTLGHIPVHIGGAGRRLTLPLVRRYADWWNCPSYAADDLLELRGQVGSARISVQHPVGLAPGRRRVDEVREVAERRFGSWGGLVCGTPHDVTQRFVDEARAGAELFIVAFTDFATPETLRLFSREVMPATQAAARAHAR